MTIVFLIDVRIRMRPADERVEIFKVVVTIFGIATLRVIRGIKHLKLVGVSRLRTLPAWLGDRRGATKKGNDYW